jgi:hypothetical protein
MYHFIIPYLYEAQHISGDTPPIIRSLKLHWQPLVFHTWKVVGHCQAHCTWQRPTTFHVWKTRGCQCSFRLLMMGGVSPEICWALYNYGIIKCWYIVASCWIFLYELFVLHMKKLLRQRQKCLLLAKWKLECHRFVSSCYFSGMISISKRIFEPSETN